MKRWKEKAGVIIKDAPRYLPAFFRTRRHTNGDPPWVRLANRVEHLEVNPHGPGVRCPWRWSSRLHACSVFPGWGSRLMQRCLSDWPICFADTPTYPGKPPQISFLFAHGGRDRLPLLRQVIRSLFAQANAAVECIVVDLTPGRAADELPPETVYRQVSTDHLPQGWYKSWAYNIAARMARSDLLVFHDGDICLPQHYAAELISLFATGRYDAASIQRFLFYLTSEATEQVLRSDTFGNTPPQSVSQNWKGGTIAITRNAFLSIGGFDEGFVDWGGEDDEFFDRCGRLRHCCYGYLPFVHLWHQPQSMKRSPHNLNEHRVLPWRLGIPANERIRELCEREFGSLIGPDPVVAYKDRKLAELRTAMVPQK